jgi:drug/metabolite transporter (DMT)-like permease
MRWLLLAGVVGSTVACDLLQAWEMKRHGEMHDFSPSRFAKLFGRWPLGLSVVFMATSFFSFIKLLSFEDLSFAVPATAASLVAETLLAKVVLREQVTGRRWAGASMVAIGIGLLART